MRAHLGNEQPPAQLSAGTVVDGRFVIERSAGSGGMATVHQALDLQTGQKVALKLLRGQKTPGLEATRLVLESQMLAELHHPRIVAYIGHGQTAAGQPYLAMEWLDGEDLSERLLRSPLRIDEVLLLLEGVAEGLSAAHSRGIIHRDIKPSNLFLPDRQIARVILLDFGVARNQERGLLLTRTGALVGTPGYMSPEQAKGLRTITPSADVFSLGCILHECLTGAPPFVAMHFSALLARILYEEVPMVRSIRPDVPEPLSQLISRMLRKESRLRPANGTQLLAELEKIRWQLALHQSVTTTQPTSPLLRQTEEHLLAVVVSSQRPPQILAPETLDYSEPDVNFVASQQELSSLLCQTGAQVERLADETIVATFRLEATATEQLTEILGHVQQVHDLWPKGLVVVTASHSDASGHAPMGKQFERVCQLLDGSIPSEPDSDASAIEPIGIFLDDGIAGLVRSVFDLDRVHPRLFRLGSSTHGSSNRPLHGAHHVEMVGRDKELQHLLSALRHSEEESIARVIVLIGRAGMGKSRLLREFVAQATIAHPALMVLHARGSLHAAANLAPLLGRALRRLSDVTAQDAGSVAHAKLIRRLKLHLKATDVEELSGPLSAICGIAPALDLVVQSEELPTYSLHQLTQAFVRFLRAEAAAGPVLLAFDDLQSADAPSLKMIETALVELSDQPILVACFADPSLASRFPRLWAQTNAETLQLHPLGPQLSEQFARAFADNQLSPEQIEQIVRLGQGHPESLRELLFWALDPGRDKFPSWLSTRVQVDSLLLPRDARRVLRAASMIGPVFWDEAVRAVVGGSADKVTRALALLTEQEWIAPQRSSRFVGCQEYRFRQLIVQECFTSLAQPDERQLASERLAVFYTQVGRAP